MKGDAVDIIDISSHNLITDWRAVAGDVPAVWIKATQGDSYTSPAFSAQELGAASAGMQVGAYHFADSDVSPAGNWAHFAAVAGQLDAFSDGRLAPLLDMEDDAADGIHWTVANAPGFIAAFIAAYRHDTGQRKIVVYANASDWQTKMRPELWADADTYLMVARYSTPPTPGNTGGFTHPQLAVHQYTDKASVPGSSGQLDRSRLIAFTPADITLKRRPDPIEEDDDMKLYPHEIYLAGAHADQNNGAPLFPFGVWRNDEGSWVGLASQAEQDSIAAAYSITPKWLEQATLAEMVRLSRVGVDTPRPTAG